MNINTITAEDLRRMPDKEGLILQGCGGDLTEWVDGINEMLTKAGILKDGSQFENVAAFQHGELTCLLYPFDDVKLDIGKLALYDMDKKMKVTCNHHDSKCAVCFERSPVICRHKAEKRRIIQNGCNKVYEICRELSLPMNRMVWDMDENGEWNGKLKGIDDYLAAIKQKEGAGAQTSALPKGEQS